MVDQNCMQNSSRDYSISMVRFASTCFIIVCHMMQWADLELAWWFNVGVQIFFCMSGYLYANRKIGSIIDYYMKTFKKVLVDYYIVIIIATVVYGIFRPDIIFATRTTIIELYFTSRTVQGGEHLWFIPYILFCYLCTPFLTQYVERNVKRHGIALLAWGGYCAAIVYAVMTLFFTRFNPAWVTCYAVGVVIGKFEAENRPSYRCIIRTMLVLAAVLNIIQISTDYLNCDLYSKLTLGKIPALYKTFCDYAHLTLGVALFAVLRCFFARLERYEWAKWAMRLIGKTSDKYSYDVYLVHQWFILGPFSLMAITKHLFLNVLLIFIIIFLSSFFVSRISIRVNTRNG